MNKDTTVNPGSVQARGVDKQSRRRKSDLKVIFARVTNLAFYVALGFLLYTFWEKRDTHHISPESGIGYALGIIGGSLMILLLAYPLRKRFGSMSRLGPVKYWFWAHMLMGVLGPVLVILHTNFNLGSINGRVALFSMLIVATSGFFGRYIYTRIHHGLYGKAVEFSDLKTHSESILQKIEARIAKAPEVTERLRAYERELLKLPGEFIPSARHWALMRWRALGLYRAATVEMLSFLQVEGRRRKWPAAKRRRYRRGTRNALRAHKRATQKLLEFHFYERLFSLWHLLHFPLFLMMIITGLVHVYAVHAY